MATQTVEFRAASGLTLSAKLFAVGSDTVTQTASTVTEATNRKGTYSAVFTDPGAAEFELVAFSGAIPVCRWFCTLTLTTATFQAYDGPMKLAPITHTSARVPNVTLVDTTTTNTDMRGTDGALLAASYTAPLTTAGTAAAVWDAALATYTTNGSFGARVVRSLNSNNTLQLTGSNHAAADIHQLQDDVITAAGIAADAVAKLQNGLATAANQVILIDRVSYALTALVGACSDAQTAAETYVLSIGGNTFTVDYSGMDASGNRSTTTLSKA